MAFPIYKKKEKKIYRKRATTKKKKKKIEGREREIGESCLFLLFSFTLLMP